MAPPRCPSKSVALWPRCVLSGGGAAVDAAALSAELEAKVLRSSAPPSAAELRIDPIARFHTARAASAVPPLRSVSGVDPALIVAHEAHVAASLPLRGGLGPQVRMLRQVQLHDGGFSSGSDSAPALLSEDAVVGGLFVSRKRRAPVTTAAAGGGAGDGAGDDERDTGGGVLGSMGIISQCTRISDVLGLSTHLSALRLVGFDPGANGVQPPPQPTAAQLRTSRSTLASRAVLGYDSYANDDFGAERQGCSPQQPQLPQLQAQPQPQQQQQQPSPPPQKQLSESGPEDAAWRRPAPTDHGSVPTPQTTRATLEGRVALPSGDMSTPPERRDAHEDTPRTSGAGAVSSRTTGRYLMHLDESFSDTVDALVQISHGLQAAPSSNGGASSAATGADSAVSRRRGACPSDPLPTKLLRHVQGSTGLVALLPESLAEHVPLLAAQVASTAAAGVLWILPEAMLASARAFWEQFATLTPGAPSVTGGDGGAGAGAGCLPGAGGTPPLTSGQMSFASLESIQTLESVTSSAPAPLLVLTATAISLEACKAVGQKLIGSPPRSRLVGLLCGLPQGGASCLAPACAALCARRLLLRCDADPDVVSLRSSRRSMPYAVPPLLRDTFEGLAADAVAQLAEVVGKRPDLLPLPLECAALKAAIESLKSAAPSLSTARPTCSPAEQQATFWGLMVCFVAKRLLGFAEEGDVEGFSGFLAQAADSSALKLQQTFQRREALRSVLAQRHALAERLAKFGASRRAAIGAAIRSAVAAGAFGKGGDGAEPHSPQLIGAKHGLLVVRKQPRSAALLEACRAAVSEDNSVSVVQITPSMDSAHVLNLLARSGSIDERLLLLLTHERLEAIAAERAAAGADGFPWRHFCLVVECDQPPEPIQLAAQLQVRDRGLLNDLGELYI